MLYFSRRSWVNAIESVKRKLEDNDTVEADEANDPSNPFSKRGEKKNKKGKSKVVSIFSIAFFLKIRKDFLLICQMSIFSDIRKFRVLKNPRQGNLWQSDSVSRKSH